MVLVFDDFLVQLACKLRLPHVLGGLFDYGFLKFENLGILQLMQLLWSLSLIIPLYLFFFTWLLFFWTLFLRTWFLVLLKFLMVKLFNFLLNGWHQRYVEVYVLEDRLLLVSQSPLLRRHPTENLLLHHLEKTLSVYRVDIYVSLKPPVFHRPRHWLANHAIGPELGQALIYGIEDRLVEDMLALLLQRRGLKCKSWLRRLTGGVILDVRPGIPLGYLVFKLSLLLNIQIHVNGKNGVLQRVNAWFKMIVFSWLLGLKLIQLVSQVFLDRLCQVFQKDRQVVYSAHLLE